MSTQVQEKIIEIVAEQAVMDPKDVSLDANLDDLGIDSLSVVEAVFAIEENFDVQVPFNSNDPSASSFDITSVRSIVGSVLELIEQKKG